MVRVGLTDCGTMIPYGHQSISEADVDEVVRVLHSNFLTQGPMVEAFEQAVAEYCGVKHAVAVANGTAAAERILGTERIPCLTTDAERS